MPEITHPRALDKRYGDILRSRKADFVDGTNPPAIMQHGAACVSMSDWPGWPRGLVSSEPAIETFVAGTTTVSATSNSAPFVTAWAPLAAWMNSTVRTALAGVGAHLDGDAFVTASLTSVESLEGLAHLDDNHFVPSASVAMVAIIGEHEGPRIATTPAPHPEMRPMTSVTLSGQWLQAFANGEVDHCAASGDQLVLFPQFGQVHAGPAARHIAHRSDTRQLLVMRAAVIVDEH